MRGAAAAVVALTLACSAVPVAAQKQEVKPATDTARQSDRASAASGSVTGRVKEATDKGIVVVGHETGKKDREWAFAVDGGTRIDVGGQSRGATELKQGDSVTVAYASRDGKVVAQSIIVKAR